MEGHYKSVYELLKSDPALKRMYGLMEGLSESRRRDLAAIAKAMSIEDRRRLRGKHHGSTRSISAKIR